MFEYLAKRFAEILTKGDVFELFKRLEQRYGTISRACERVGIERRTFYHWRNARQINFETKAKVLKVALEEHLIDTLEFLAGRSRRRLKEVLEYLIEVLRREILEEDEPDKLDELVKRAERVINEYSIPVIEYLRHEVGDLVEAAYSKGYKIKLRPVTPASIFGIQMVKVEYTEYRDEWMSSATVYQYMGVKVEKRPEGAQVQFEVIGEPEG